MTTSQKISTILLAGGKSSRMEAKIPKPFLPLGPKILARHSFDFLFPYSSELIVVTDPAYQTFFPETTQFAHPGKRRQDSLWNGLQLATSDWILVHDAARPFIETRDIENLIEAAFEFGAACLASPVTSTIKSASENQLVEATLEREKLWEIHTPQMIKRSLLLEGFRHAQEENLTLTDDVALVELLGKPVKLVSSSPQNLKITYPHHLEMARQHV